MAKRISIISFFILFLIVLAGIYKAAAGMENASSAAYQLKLSSQTSSPIHDSDEAILLPASDKTIVQAVHFKLAQEFLFVLGLIFSLLLTFKVVAFKAPSFSNSYFDNTFCHHIAINAP